MEQREDRQTNLEHFDCDQFTDIAAKALGVNIRDEHRQGVIDNVEIAKSMAIKVFSASMDSNCSSIAPTFSPKARDL